MDLRARLNVTGLIDRTIVEEGWKRAIPRMAAAVHSRAYANLSGRLVAVRTGRLRSALRQVIETRPNGLPAAEIGTVHPSLGPVFEGGADPHDIKSPRGRLLRFRVGDRWVTARQVKHPGLAPRRWLASAVSESQPDFDRILLEEFEAAAARASGRLRAG